MEGTIINITRFCTDDGPGIRTTVFLKGCPLKCAWCHNPESQNSGIEAYTDGETIGRRVTAEEVVQEVVRDRIFYETSGGGVTVSGGEPLFQPDFTGRILKLCKDQGIHTAIETSGFAGIDVLHKVLEHCDLVLFDIKETNDVNHERYAGVPLLPILENLKRIHECGIPFVIRLPIIPGYNDREDHFAAVKELAETLSCCQGIEVMPYHSLGAYKYERLGRAYLCKAVVEPTKAQIDLWKSLCK